MADQQIDAARAGPAELAPAADATLPRRAGRVLVLRLSFAVLVLAVGGLVFGVAALFAIRSENLLVKSMPILVPYSAFVASLLFSLNKETRISDLARRAILGLQCRQWLLHAVTLVTLALAVGLNVFVWQAAHAPDGVFSVQVVREQDVADHWMPGIPVELEQKSRPETQSKVTDSQGYARFPVNAGDIFAIRLRESARPDARVMALGDSRFQVDGGTKQEYRLVRFAELPENAWVTPKPGSDRPKGIFDFAEIPSSFFRWRDSLGPPTVVLGDPTSPSFPFDLPAAEIVVRRVPYVIGFSPLLRLPRWAAYRIEPGENIQRERDNWQRDPAIAAASQASREDYRANDYDLGLLVRRADLFGLGETEMLKVFYFSVAVPQLSVVNLGTWAALENYSNAKAYFEGKRVFILRGPIFEPTVGASTVGTNLMGPNQIPVPTHFFQVLMAVAPDGATTVEAHIVPNSYVGTLGGSRSSHGVNVAQFHSTVEEIEELTGLTFDPVLRAGQRS